MFVKKSSYDEVVANNAELNEQVETLTTERDAAISERDTLQTSIDDGGNANDNTDMEATLSEVVNSLDAIDDSIQNVETPQEKVSATAALISTLRQTPGAKSAIVTSKTEQAIIDGKAADKNVVSEKKDFMGNLASVTEEFL
jgi:seryl-tRNA synthetase